MKKNRSIVGAVLLGIVALAITGCSQLPQEKLDAANLGLQEAATSGAEVYATESYMTLKDSLNAALESIETQKSKFMKSYSEAETKLDGVIAYAAEVKKQTEVNKETMRTEIATAITDIKTLLDENKQLIIDAPKGKEGTAALIAIKSELTTIETTVAESETMMKTDQLMPAKEKAMAAKEKATSINTELKSVIAKYKAARR